MLKKIGLPFLALAAMLMVIPPQTANAAVRFGVVIGGGPVYPYPAYPGPYAYPYAYPDPYYNAYPPYSVYSYPAPAYVYPHGSWRGHERHENFEHRDHGRQEHGYRGHDDFHGHRR
jgi:hypothetical protein